MKHPRREEWVPFIFGEAEAEQQAQLEEHLKQCEECSTEVGRWRSSLQRMDAWQLPPRVPQRRRAIRFQPAAWAAAAVLVLALGIAAGQRSSHAAQSEMAQLKMQVAEMKKLTAGML